MVWFPQLSMCHRRRHRPLHAGRQPDSSVAQQRLTDVSTTVLMRVVGPLPAVARQQVWAFLHNPYKILIVPNRLAPCWMALTSDMLPVKSDGCSVSMQTSAVSPVRVADFWNRASSCVPDVVGDSHMDLLASAIGAPHIARCKPVRLFEEGLEIIVKMDGILVTTAECLPWSNLPFRIAWEKSGQQPGQLVMMEASTRLILLERDAGAVRLYPEFVAMPINMEWAAILVNGCLYVVDMDQGDSHRVCEADVQGAIVNGNSLVVVKRHTLEVYRCGAAAPELEGVVPIQGEICYFNANNEAIALKVSRGLDDSGKQVWLCSLIKISTGSTLRRSQNLEVGAVTCLENVGANPIIPSANGLMCMPVGSDQLALCYNSWICEGFLQVWSFSAGSDKPQCIVQADALGPILTMAVHGPGVSSDWMAALTLGPRDLIPPKRECVDLDVNDVFTGDEADILLEPVAVISPEEAAAIQAARWHSFVEHQLSNARLPECGATHGAFLLTFSRSTARLEEAILSSAVAKRACARGTDPKPDWANGAKILVDGLKVEHIEAPVVERLGAQHVLVSRYEREELMDSLNVLPYSIRKLKPNASRNIPEITSLMCMSFDEDDAEEQLDIDWQSTEDLEIAIPTVDIQVRCTFVHFSENSDLASWGACTV